VDLTVVRHEALLVRMINIRLERRGVGLDTKAAHHGRIQHPLLFYGMTAYTGHNASADGWRAGIFVVLLVVPSA
jgi:hypothetical protein